jgi:hypothetical protein
MTWLIISVIVNIDNHRNTAYRVAMDTMNNALLASAHQQDLLREARANRLASLIERCRRRRFGFLPIARPCEPRSCS